MTTGPETPPPDPTEPYGSTPPPPPPPASPGYQGYTAPGVPAGGYGVSSQAPYGLDPRTGIPYSDKQKLVAGLLQILLPFGIGRYYIGDTTTGVWQTLATIFTCGLAHIWVLVDGILMLTRDDTKDARGYILRP